MKAFCFQIFNLAQSTGMKPLSGGDIRGLGVHVDEPVAFSDGNQVVLGFAVGVTAFLAPNPRPGGQQFPAPAGIFNVYHLSFAADFHMGKKAVGPGKKPARYHSGVFHNLHLPLCRV